MAYKALITTLCYIRRDNCYLMLHRIKKKNDLNEGKWVGIGGKLEEGESPEDCMRREVFEETGLQITHADFKGVITFLSDTWDDEYMMLYEADQFDGVLKEDCPEGELAWVPFEQIMSLPLWEGDRYFLEPLIAGSCKINGKVRYEGDTLVGVSGFEGCV